MTKRLTAKVGTYQKDGQTKGRYVDIGVILSNSNGEYILLDPTVNLSGVLSLQNKMAIDGGNVTRDRVAVSIFDNSNRQSGQQPGQSGGFGGGDMDDEIPW